MIFINENLLPMSDFHLKPLHPKKIQELYYDMNHSNN